MAFHKNLETLNLHIQVRFTVQVSKCESICLLQIFKEWQECSWFSCSAGSSGLFWSLTPLYRTTYPWRVCCPCDSGKAPSSWLTASVKHWALLLNFYTFLVLLSLLTSCSGYRLLLGSLWILRRACSFYTNWQQCQLKGFVLDSTTSMFLLFFEFWWLFLILPSSKWDTCC